MIKICDKAHICIVIQKFSASIPKYDESKCANENYLIIAKIFFLFLMLAKAYEDVLKQKPKNLQKVVRLAQTEIVYNLAAISQHQSYRKVIYVRKEKCK